MACTWVMTIPARCTSCVSLCGPYRRQAGSHRITTASKGLMCLWELACRRQGQWGQLICPAISPSATVIIAPPGHPPYQRGRAGTGAQHGLCAIPQLIEKPLPNCKKATLPGAPKMPRAHQRSSPITAPTTRNPSTPSPSANWHPPCYSQPLKLLSALGFLRLKGTYLLISRYPSGPHHRSNKNASPIAGTHPGSCQCPTLPWSQS